MRISPVTTSISNTHFTKNNRILRQQYLERFEHKTPEIKTLDGIKKLYNGIQKFFLFAGAYSIGLLGYELRTNNYEALDKQGVINYIEPQKNKFDSRRDVYNYAINQATKALNSSQPYEHAVYINNANNEVLAEFEGNKDKVYTAISFIDKLKLKLYGEGATLIHGHPSFENGVTPPISHPDFETLCNNDFLTEIVAVDKKGKVSLLRKTPFFSPPNETIKELVSTELVVILFDSFEETQPDKFVEIISAYQKETDSLKTLELKKELDYYVLGQDSTEYTNRAIHEYWQTTAKKLGLEYYTNFSK